MAKEDIKYEDIMQQLQLRQFKPIYVFMGEEAYYIDKLTNYLEENILTDDEKSMNQLVCYGKDANIPQLINEARQFPMMSQYRVVILKEAQALERKADIDLFESYIKQMSPTTILVIAYKYGKIDERKSWIKLARQNGVVWTSAKLYDNQVERLIPIIAKNNNLSIDPPATKLLQEYIGNDLQQIENVIKKMAIMTEGKTQITVAEVEKSTGITHEYNAFELLNALINHDEVKAMRIATHISVAIQAITATLFNYFQNLMILHYTADKSKNNVVSVLKINPYFYQDYEKGLKNYNSMKTFRIIGMLREYDGKSKGIGSTNVPDKELLIELIYKILH